MADELVKIIAKADFEYHLQIAANMDYDRMMEPHVLNAQLYDLRPVIGDALYVDMVKNRASAPYDDLIAGGEYTYNGIDYFFQGIKKPLVHFAYARYCMRNGAQDTASGLRRKLDQQWSDPLPMQEATKEAEYHRQLAVASLADCITYIKRNIEDFPLFTNTDDCSTMRSQYSGAIRITPVSR